MSIVLITGANGFIGQMLKSRLLEDGLDGQPINRIILSDLSFASRSSDSRLVYLPGSLVSSGVIERCLEQSPNVIFHLASVPGSAAERDPLLGQQVNLEATIKLIKGCRHLRKTPRFVYASSIAVYGTALSAQMTESIQPVPSLSYGAHKLASEILLADASRRGELQACSVRLPGVVARPDAPTGMGSAFMSQLLLIARTRQPLCLPVSPQGACWWISAYMCVKNLIHLAVMDPGCWNSSRSYQMPFLHLSISQITDTLAQMYGVNIRSLLTYAPQKEIERLFASYPEFPTPDALAMGLKHDASIRDLIRHATMSPA